MGSESSDRAGEADSSRPDCPRCDEPVGFVAVSGPTTASVSPCGCTVPAAAVQRE
ncbi:hypothetical protein [Natrinema saccharevitans]|uniref:hypothetical protein n=1 Tax=Natrinema saccharevitans TaxID=301967 RepID=UPI00158F1E50|nr:hypothetical protein [Natrinema saccharevitans]